MARRTSRRPKVVWLQQDVENRLGNAPLAAPNGGASSTIQALLSLNGFGAAPDVLTIPIVRDDQTQEVTSENFTLADATQSGYRLRRIVGKICISVAQDPNGGPVAADPTGWVITAGFIILRVLGSAVTGPLLGLNDVRYSPSRLDRTDDPWIWRRTWVLSDQTSSNALLRDFQFPTQNMVYGAGAQEGTHVDAKTARIVGPDERLFLVLDARGIDGESQGSPGVAVILADLRILASMRSMVGNRRNASR